MKKLRKEEELNLLINSSMRIEYAKEFGICAPNLTYLYQEQTEIFNQVIVYCKRIPDEIIEFMIEDEKYLETIMTRCLSEKNQVKFVDFWPEKVKEYLETLENNLTNNGGAFLCSEAQNLYEEIREEDPSLPKIKSYINTKTSTGNCPFAGLVGLI